MNYYDHDIKVKVIDGVLAHDQNWEWFIKHTEETFEVELKGDSMEETLDSFREIRDVFDFLSRIHEICDKDLQISASWLKEVDVLSKFYIGLSDIESTPVTTNFSKIMRLLIYAGKIYGQIKNKKYYYHVDIFNVRNFFHAENLEPFADEEQKILALIAEINIDLSKEQQIFLDNINKKSAPVDTAFIVRHREDFYNANCFSFTSIKDPCVRIWEERELLEMLSLSYRDGKIVPRINFGDSFIPDYTLWTQSLLQHIKDYFKSDEVSFVIESIAYMIYGTIPSSNTVNKHFELLYNLSENEEDSYHVKMMCSSIEIILCFFSDDSRKHITGDSYKKYSSVLNKMYDKDCMHLLVKIKDAGALTDKAVNEKLKATIQQQKEQVGKISGFTGFIQYIKNKLILKDIGNIHLEVLVEKFTSIAESTDGVRVASLFLEYFLFLLRIKNNRDIKASAVSEEIIRIRALWKEKYFAMSCSAMQTVQTGSFTLPKDYSKQLLQQILLVPTSFAKNRMMFQQETLIKKMQSLSSNPFTILAKRIAIAEDFPYYPSIKIDGKHPIDKFFLDKVDQTKQDFAYKFMNSFSAKEYTEEIFESIKQDLRILIEIFDEIESLYTVVCEQNPDYDFLPFDSEVKLAHLTQLFPVLENKIREFGELFGIVPVCEDIDICHRLKEPDTVLKLIISQIYDMGGDISDAPDLFFIHFCMFGENGLNIRNACIHGNGYCHGSQISFAFKVTLIALYMIGWRLEVVLGNMKRQEASEDTKIEHKNEGVETTPHLTKVTGLRKIWNRFSGFIRKLFTKN